MHQKEPESNIDNYELEEIREQIAETLDKSDNSDENQAVNLKSQISKTVFRENRMVFDQKSSPFFLQISQKH